MVFGIKHRRHLPLGHKIRSLRHNVALGQKIGHGLKVGGRAVSGASRTGAMGLGIGSMLLAGTPAGAAMQAGSKGLLGVSMASEAASQGGSKMEKKSKRIQAKKKRDRMEGSEYL